MHVVSSSPDDINRAQNSSPGKEIAARPRRDVGSVVTIFPGPLEGENFAWGHMLVTPQGRRAVGRPNIMVEMG